MRTGMTAIRDIKQTFFIRIGLDEDRVLHFAQLIEAGADLPPILLAEDSNDLVDGRHRKAAYELVGRNEVPTIHRKFTSLTEMIIAALSENTGGALPPSTEDIDHTMGLLLGQGVSRKDIIDKIHRAIGFPKLLISRHLSNVQSQMFKKRLAKAVSAVLNDGKTVVEAATENNVPVDKLQKALAGDSDDRPSINGKHFDSHLRQRFHSFNKSMAKALSQLMRCQKDGVVEEKEVKVVVDQLKRLSARQNEMFAEWVKRFGGVIPVKPQVEKKQPPKEKPAKKTQTGESSKPEKVKKSPPKSVLSKILA